MGTLIPRAILTARLLLARLNRKKLILKLRKLSCNCFKLFSCLNLEVRN